MIDLAPWLPLAVLLAFIIYLARGERDGNWHHYSTKFMRRRHERKWIYREKTPEESDEWFESSIW